MIPSKYSFRLLSRAEIKKIRLDLKSKNNNFNDLESNLNQTEQSEGSKKRLFLKMAGVVGLGAVASLLLPKKAQALVFGSTPAANVVGVKDSANLRIDPAKEGTAALIKTAAEATKINTDTLVTNSNKFTFSGDSLMTVGAAGSDVMGLKNSNDTRINPVMDDTVVLLRRMVKLMESQATVDSANRQRVTLDAWGTSVLVGTGTSASCPRVALGTDSTVGTVSSVTNVVTIGGWAAQQMYGDVAHDVYANAIRRNLTFS